MYLEVCFSPYDLPLYDVSQSIVVVIDVLRATSSICVGFAYGVEKMYPVETLEECEQFRKMGCIGAAERNGEKIQGFELGNSPFDYMGNHLKGKQIAITTTNGTRALHAAKNQNALEIVIGAFTNADALTEWLANAQKNVLFLCAGWKDKFNLEDTLFAGLMVHRLRNLGFSADSDTAHAAELLYVQAQNHIHDFLKNSSHAKRLAHLNIQRDIAFCLQPGLTKVIPIFEQNYLYNHLSDQWDELGIAELSSFSSSLIEASNQ